MIGQFVSPDTIVPEPNQVFAYNRYMYVMGNPLRYNDPTGHCATTSNGDADESDAECWRLARTIGNMWDSTDYWQNRYGDVNVWTDHISPSGVDAQFMVNELDMFFNSDAGRSWLDNTLQVSRPEQDFGDYTSVNGGLLIGDFSLIIDDFGNLFLRVGVGPNTPGGSVTRGDIFVTGTYGQGDQGAALSQFTATDIDQMGLSRNEKQALMQDLMVGFSRGGSVNYRFLAVGGSKSESAITTEGGVGGRNPGGGYSHSSYTWHLWTFGGR